MKRLFNLVSGFMIAFALFPAIQITHAGARQSTDDAISHYKSMVKENPESIKAQCGLAEAYINKYISTGKTKKAMLFRAKNAIKTAEKIDDKSPLPYITWAKYFMAMGEKETAVKRAQKAAVLDPDNSEAQKLLEKLGINRSVAERSKGRSNIEDIDRELELLRQERKLLEKKHLLIDEGQQLLKDELNDLKNDVKRIEKENKENYVGEYKNGKRHGQGTFTFPDGGVYVGEWKDDKRHGQGIFTWSDGSEYRGEFRNDKNHGQGTYTWASGQKYVGEFTKGKLTGGWLHKTNGSRTWSYIDSSGKWVHQESKP